MASADKMSEAYTQKDLELGKLLKCVCVVGNKTLCDVAKAMYKSKRKETRDGALTLRKYMSAAQVKDRFGDKSQQLLDCNIMMRDFDISFANKVIQEICQKEYNNLSEHCRTQIKFLVNYRNDLSHAYVLETLDIAKRGAVLKGVLADIYKGVSKSLNKGVPKTSRINFDDNIQIVFESIRKTLESPIKVDEASRYINEFKETLIFKLVQYGVGDIIHYYDKLRPLHPFTWTDDPSDVDRFKLENVFTVPKLVNEYSEAGDISLEDILTEKKCVGGEEVVPSTIVLQGESGSGKTSFCYYLIHQWKSQSHSIRDLQKFTLVLPVEIRRTSSQKIEEYLRQVLLKETFRILKPEDVLNVLKELDILFIIDGYDEGNQKSHGLVRDIFNIFGKKRIIITTRTTFKEEVIAVTKRYKTEYILINLKGFDEVRQLEYISKVFDGMERSHEDFKRYIKGRGKVLGKHLRLPLTLALMIVLWIFDRSRLNHVTTGTSLYKELFELFKVRLMERLITNHKYSGEKALQTVLDELILAIASKAWFMLQEGRVSEFSEEEKTEIDNECRKNGISEPHELLSAFLTCSTDADSDENRRVFSFFHKTQTEYMASVHLAMLIKKKSDFTSEVNDKDWRRYDQLLIYLTGNLALQDCLKGKESYIVDLTSKVDEQSVNYSYWWDILSESRLHLNYPEKAEDPITYKGLMHPQIGELIAEKPLFKHVSWNPDFNNVAPALRLISLIPVKVENLKISIPADQEPFDIPDFIEAIEEIGRHYNEGDEIISTELMLWKHDSFQCEKSSDRFLRALKPWANLERFVGGLQCSMNMKKQFPKLKNITCKITDPEILSSFKGLRSSVRILRLSLEFKPDKCSPDKVKDLAYCGSLELYFQDMKDEHLEWMCDVIKKLSGKYGCQSLFLKNSELSYNGLQRLVENLNGLLQSILEVRYPNEISEDMEDHLQRTARFRINWI